MVSSGRRFDLGSSTQPVLQLIAASIPIVLLLLWFIVNAHARPKVPCYESASNVNDDEIIQEYYDECSRLIPLVQFLYVYLVFEFLSVSLAGYLTFFVPRRHNLVNAYLTQGEVVIGDIYYNRRKLGGMVALTHYGNVVYTHPHNAVERIRRRIQVFERYTRERAALLYLPGYPYSGQSKLDLEIDRDVIELNKDRVRMLTWCSIIWVLFCLLGPIYIVHVLKSLDADNVNPDEYVWQPDVNIGENFFQWYYLISFLFIPLFAFICNVISWFLYKHWMTTQYKILKDDEPAVEPASGCFFDDEDCETIDAADYQPPSTEIPNK